MGDDGHPGHLDAVPVKEKKFKNVKIKELPNWIPMWNLTPKCTVRSFQRGYYQYDNKYVSVKKGSIPGLLCWVLAVTCFSTTTFLTKNSNMNGYTGTTEEGPAWKVYSTFLTMTFFALHLSLKNSIFAESFYILIERWLVHLKNWKIFKRWDLVIQRLPVLD